MLSDALRNIVRIGRCSVTYRVQRPVADDLAGVQHLYIVHACSHPGDTQEQFARAICVDKTTVAHQLLRLEKDGYIARRPDAQDGRCRRVYPTEKAEAVLPRIREETEAFTDAALRDLTDDERDTLCRLTAKVYDNTVRLLENDR